MKTSTIGIRELVVDARVVGNNQLLRLISHGRGSAPWVYRDLAAHAARAGCVVALPTQPGNHRGSNRLANTRRYSADRAAYLPTMCAEFGAFFTS